MCEYLVDDSVVRGVCDSKSTSDFRVFFSDEGQLSRGTGISNDIT